MALTAKPISTISYNTEPFIRRLLSKFLDAHIINNFMYICHQGEDGDKDHIHVYIEPNRRIDTGLLREEFKEITTEGDKPLGCMPFRSSVVGHWLMYVIHDPDYLKAHKSQDDGDGKIPYTIDEVMCAFEEQRDRDYRKALVLKQTDNQKVIDGVKEGKSLVEIAYAEDVSPTKILAIHQLLKLDEEPILMAQYALEGVLESMKKERETLVKNNERVMLRDLEKKTGLNLHSEEEEDD